MTNDKQKDAELDIRVLDAAEMSEVNGGWPNWPIFTGSTWSVCHVDGKIDNDC